MDWRNSSALRHGGSRSNDSPFRFTDSSRHSGIRHGIFSIRGVLPVGLRIGGVFSQGDRIVETWPMNDQLPAWAKLIATLLGFSATYFAVFIVTRVAAIIYQARLAASSREMAIIRNRLGLCGCVENSPPHPPQSQPIPDRQRRRLLTASTTHCGHAYVIRFAPDHHQQAVDQVLRWVDDESVNLDAAAACRLGISISRALLVYSESRGQDESACD